MPQTVEQALAQATFYNDDQDYALVKLHPRAITAAAGLIAEVGEPFAAMIVDKDEVTLLIPSEAIEDFQERLTGYSASPMTYRLITIDVELEPELTGFIARISRALADAGIPILTYAAFMRDHLFVPAEKLDTALSVLDKLKTGS